MLHKFQLFWTKSIDLNWFKVQQTATSMPYVFLRLYLQYYIIKKPKKHLDISRHKGLHSIRKCLFKMKRIFSYLDWNCLENHIRVTSHQFHMPNTILNIYKLHHVSSEKSVIPILQMRKVRLSQDGITRRFANFTPYCLSPKLVVSCGTGLKIKAQI